MMPEPTELFYNTILARLSFLESEVKRLSQAKDTPIETSLFERVMTISPAYVARFGGVISLEGAKTKMREEWDEFQHAVGAYAVAMTDNTPLSLRLKSPNQLRTEAAGELIDLLVTVGGLASAIGVTFEEIEQASRATLAKLDKRTPETHAWNTETMTVERIGKVAK